MEAYPKNESELLSILYKNKLTILISPENFNFFSWLLRSRYFIYIFIIDHFNRHLFKYQNLNMYLFVVS